MSGNTPFKNRGWNQGLHEVSSTPKEAVGTLRITENGRKFRYARAGAAALAAGKLGVAAAINAAHADEAILAAVPIGTTQLVLTVTAGAVILENELRGGQLQINDAVGEGHAYEISSNSALAIAGTEITLTLADPIRVALTVASEFTLVHSPWNDVIEDTTLAKACGVPLVPVPIANYYWAQTGGLGIGLMDGAIAAGSLLQQSNAVAGAMEIYAAATVTFKPVAEVFGTAGVDTEYQPIFLHID